MIIWSFSLDTFLGFSPIFGVGPNPFFMNSHADASLSAKLSFKNNVSGKTRIKLYILRS